MELIGCLPIDVISHIILFLKVEHIKHKVELASKSFFDVATRRGIWYRLYIRDFLTSKAKTVKKPTALRKRRRVPGPSSTVPEAVQQSSSAPKSTTSSGAIDIPDRPWDRLYKVRYAKKLRKDINFLTESSEAQTAILDLELAESMTESGPTKVLSNGSETNVDSLVESLLFDDKESTQATSDQHDCGSCCRAAVPSKDQFGVFVCPFTGRMFEASTIKQVTDTWDTEYSPFSCEESGADDTACMRDDVGEDWTRPGVWGRCFSEGYDCITESECEQMLQRYKRQKRQCNETTMTMRKLRRTNHPSHAMACSSLLDMIDQCGGIC